VAQLIVGGAEITNQYAELINPLTQRELLTAQAKAREQGDEEAMEIDEEFLSAMEHGMPPMTGFGMGIDRLVAMLTEQRNLRDVIFFPIMHPRE
jgi:lysyl-tRNA synthetase class 2